MTEWEEVVSHKPLDQPILFQYFETVVTRREIMALFCSSSRGSGLPFLAVDGLAWQLLTGIGGGLLIA